MQNVDADVLEVLDAYIEMVEKQEEVICRLSELVRKQAYQIQHLKNLYNFTEGASVEELNAQQALSEYENLRNRL